MKSFVLNNTITAIINSQLLDNIKEFASKLNPSLTKLKEPLSKHTTLGIGGQADIWYEATSTDELVNTVKLARASDIPVTILGWGSNVLISDNGIRGLVIHNKSDKIVIEGETEVSVSSEVPKIKARLDQIEANASEQFIKDFSTLDYDESNKPSVKVKMDSGVYLPYAINYLINKGITGLQWFSRIPGTIGGGIFNNIHGGSHFFSEAIESVLVLDQNNKERVIHAPDLEFDYDYSRFHHSKEIILQGHFILRKGDSQKARMIVSEWANRKKVQPNNSPGCAFANISDETKQKNNFPSNSIGWLVEKGLGLSGYQEGDIAIHDKHHNFIVNKGNGTAKEYLNVLKKITKDAKEKFDIDLITEIFFLGFNDSELEGLNVAGTGKS